MRRHRHAVAGADARIDQRLIDRREQIVDRRDRSRHECGRDSLRPGFDRDRRRFERQPLLAGVAHAGLDFEHRRALAVDRDFEQLVPPRHVDCGVAEQFAAHGAHERRGNPVEAVRGERVHHRRAAARTERRAVDELHLVLGRQYPIGRAGRRRGAIADGEAADLTGRAQVALRQRRREGLRVRDVVEPLAHRVGREVRRDVDVDVEQILDRPRVLRARQTLERSPPRIRMRRGPLIHPRFEGAAQILKRRVRGTPRARRRHHAGAQLADHLLGGVGMLACARDVEVGERQITSLRPIVVTAGAVLLHGLRRGVARDVQRARRRRL